MDTRDGVNVALRIIGSAGFDGVSVATPTAREALALLLKKTPARSADHARILTELRRQQLVEMAEDGRSVRFVISLAGAYRLEKLIIEDLSIEAPRRWDGKWRTVTFDIPLEHSRQRAAFTAHLARLGFAMLQKSLWVHPYPCFEQVEQLGSYYNILRWCSLFEVNYFDKLSDKKLRKLFNL